MYEAKTEMFNVINQSEVARIVGIKVETMNRIVNKKQLTTKKTAYCITKAIFKEAEIEDFFNHIDKKGE